MFTYFYLFFYSKIFLLTFVNFSKIKQFFYLSICWNNQVFSSRMFTLTSFYWLNKFLTVLLILTLFFKQQQLGISLDDYDTSNSDGGNLNQFSVGNQSPDGVMRSSNVGGNTTKKQGVVREQSNKKNKDRKNEKRKTLENKCFEIPVNLYVCMI